MDRDDFFKYPRLFMEAPLTKGADILLDPEQVHYFKTVLRRQDGAPVRVFNGKDGEWLCRLERLGKKEGHAVAQEQIRPQPAPEAGIHLFFAPIKKARLDWLVEKAVELGAAALHPVITQNTEVRTLNDNRLRHQIMEAAEQCERMDCPALYPAVPLQALPGTGVKNMEMFVALERGKRENFPEHIEREAPVGILIGPEGGFTVQEAQWMAAQEGWRAISLGPRILRSETAACAALSWAMLMRA